MADRNSLGVVGLIMAGVTVAVVITAGWVVNAHVAGHMVLDSSHSVAELSGSRVR